MLNLHQEETDLIAKETENYSARLQSLRDSRDYRLKWAESEGINIPGTYSMHHSIILINV